ncbi:hypothetical protein RFI_19540 [Reticulomyxa filosa]|uniref:Ion transport domain-containing protein n=1 Tax=Reticulomyxa filosa TaxID=46433 RepID=X6MUU8_RETFI|nr:hypothetical protein RFI_19540 [Reticulomyxa filosa]|eukprot:ETO17773.1 hypothetical protein RFI_19540 [Reticulomyxa filosa]
MNSHEVWRIIQTKRGGGKARGRKGTKQNKKSPLYAHIYIYMYSEDNEILQYILPQAESIRVKDALKVTEEDIKQILHAEVNERRQVRVEQIYAKVDKPKQEKKTIKTKQKKKKKKKPHNTTKKELVRRRIWNYLYWHRDRTVIYGYSLMYFGMDHPLRKKLQKLVISTVKTFFCLFYSCQKKKKTIIIIFLHGLKKKKKQTTGYHVHINEHSQNFKILHWFDVGFVVIFSVEILLKIAVFGFISRPLHDQRSWNKIVDPVWQYMCEHDRENLNASLYNNDLGIFEVTKARDGLVIVHCIVPSTGLELRVLFDEAEWKYIFICRQYGLSTKTSEESIRIEPSISKSKRNDDDDDDDIIPLVIPADVRDRKLTSEEEAREGAGKSTSVSGMLSVRKWVRWEPLDESKHTKSSRKYRTSTGSVHFKEMRLDNDIKQMMTSVSLTLDNANAFCEESWNILDASVVLLSIFALIFNWRHWSTLRALRVFRVVIRYNPMRIILTSLGRGLSSIVSGMLFGFLIMVCFAVIGLNFFSTSSKVDTSADFTVLSLTFTSMFEISFIFFYALHFISILSDTHYQANIL